MNLVLKTRGPLQLVEVLRASLLRYEKSISDDLAISEVQPCPVCF